MVSARWSGTSRGVVMFTKWANGPRGWFWHDSWRMSGRDLHISRWAGTRYCYNHWLGWGRLYDQFWFMSSGGLTDESPQLLCVIQDRSGFSLPSGLGRYGSLWYYCQYSGLRWLKIFTNNNLAILRVGFHFSISQFYWFNIRSKTGYWTDDYGFTRRLRWSEHSKIKSRGCFSSTCGCHLLWLGFNRLDLWFAWCLMRLLSQSLVIDGLVKQQAEDTRAVSHCPTYHSFLTN